MGFELLSQADLVLNACGRQVPPPGYKFVDLPKILPFQHTAIAPVTVWSSVDGSGNGVSLTFTGFNAPNITVQTTNTAGPFSITVTGNTPFQATVSINLSSTTAFKVKIVDFVAFIVQAATYPQFQALRNLGVNVSTIGASTTDIVSATFTAGSSAIAEEWPQTGRIENTTPTLFVVSGIMLQTDPISVRLKWPNGRYWNQFPSGNPFQSAGSCFPQGTGGNLFALDEEVVLEKGGRVTVEMSGPNAGTVNVQLWGRVRYLLKDDGMGGGSVDGQTCIVGYPDAAHPNGKPNCIIGYPVSAAAQGKSGTTIISDPIQELIERTRFTCWPNGNIMAPEFLLGNQCDSDAPDGYQDFPFTFFSNPVTLSPQQPQSFDNSLNIPGAEDIILRRWRAVMSWASAGSQLPAFITNGDIGQIAFLGTPGTVVQCINQAGTPNLPFFISVVGSTITLGAATDSLGDALMAANLAPALIAANAAAAALITAVDPSGDFPIMGSTTVNPSGGGGGQGGLPQVGIKFPNGYSITGGDLIPVSFPRDDGNALWWTPFFPTARMKAGKQIILDFAYAPYSGTAAVTVQIEFDAAKRRRIQ